MFRFFTVIVTFRPQGMPHNHIKIFYFHGLCWIQSRSFSFYPFKKNHHFASMRCVTFIILPTVIADGQHSRHPPGNVPAKPSPLPLHASRHKKKKKSQYLHVLPVIYDGGFSKLSFSPLQCFGINSITLLPNCPST